MIAHNTIKMNTIGTPAIVMNMVAGKAGGKKYEWGEEALLDSAGSALTDSTGDALTAKVKIYL